MYAITVMANGDVKNFLSYNVSNRECDGVDQPGNFQRIQLFYFNFEFEYSFEDTCCGIQAPNRLIYI